MKGEVFLSACRTASSEMPWHGSEARQGRGQAFSTEKTLCPWASGAEFMLVLDSQVGPWLDGSVQTPFP